MIFEENDTDKKGAVTIATLRKILESGEFSFPSDALDKIF